jgi:excisionase family DNA binding protein
VARRTKAEVISTPKVAEGAYHLTSGDMARLLHVDLKTIHNWLSQGHIQARRTEGRHLRFNRTEVVRFMRRYGYSLPETLGLAPPRVVLDRAKDGKLAGLKGLRQGFELTICEGLYACALLVAAGDQELVLVDLDEREHKPLKEFVSALRAWPLSAGVVLVGVSSRPASRRAFLRWGGDVAVPAGQEADLRSVALWMVGASPSAPASAELSASLGSPSK